MAINLTPERAEAIVAIVGRYPRGATLVDIARDLPGAPEARKLRGWLETIALGGAVTLEGTGDDIVVRLGTSAAATAASVPVSPQSPPRPPAAAPPAPATAPVPPAAPVPSVPSVLFVPSVPSAPTDALPSDAPPAPTATPPAAPTDPATDQMMLEAVQYVVAYGIVPETSTFHLQGAARKEGLSVPAAVAFVNRLVALLTTLSEADAVSLYGLSAAQYAEWVEHCALAGHPRRGVAASATVEPTPETTAAPPAAPPPHDHVAGVADPGPAPVTLPDPGPSSGTPRRRIIAGIADSDAGVAGVVDPGAVVAAVRDHGQTAAIPPAVTPNTVINPTAAPGGSPRPPTRVPRSRTLRTTGWAVALLAAGLGVYQFRNHLPTASAPAATPVVHPPSAPPSSKTIPAPTPTAPIENRASNTEAAKPPTSTIENPSPPQSAVRTPQFDAPFPSAAGAYLLSAGRWLPLPRNNGQVLTIDDDRPRPPQANALLIFAGDEPPPRLPATGAVIAIVGAAGWTASQLARYPALRDEQAYPRVELAALASDDSGARSTWWSELFPGVTGIGPSRLPATLEHSGSNVTLLRPIAPLAPGRYAVCSGTQYFELAVD